MTPYNQLVASLNLFASPADNEPVAFGESMDMLGQSTYTFTATLAVLPFLQPIPLGLFALIGSAAFMAMGTQLFKGRQSLILPDKIRSVTLSLRSRRALVATCLKIINFFRLLSRPRLSFLISGNLGRQISGFIFISVSLLVAIPLGGIVPFKNLFPSLAILLWCTAQIEQDGLMAILAIGCVILAVLFYSLLIYIAWKFGASAINHLFWK